MESVEALQSVISGAAGEGGGFGGSSAFEPVANSTAGGAWAPQNVLKRIVKLTMEVTSAAAIAGMNERRAQGLARNVQVGLGIFAHLSISILMIIR